jgi:hypothetical protein
MTASDILSGSMILQALRVHTAIRQAPNGSGLRSARNCTGPDFAGTVKGQEFETGRQLNFLERSSRQGFEEWLTWTKPGLGMTCQAFPQRPLGILGPPLAGVQCGSGRVESRRQSLDESPAGAEMSCPPGNAAVTPGLAV